MCVTRFLLGIDLGGTKMAMATARFDGTVLRSDRLPTRAGQAMRRALEPGRQLVELTARETDCMLDPIGLATMGVTRDDRVIIALNVPGWERPAIPGRLRSTFPDTASGIENDVKAAARAELLWGALRGCRTAAYGYLGTGIAPAVIVDGHVVQDAHGAAGEIAHNMRSSQETDGAASGRAPLEEFIGGRAIGRRLQSRGSMRRQQPMSTEPCAGIGGARRPQTPQTAPELLVRQPPPGGNRR